MGQIIGRSAKPKRCNLNQLSQLGTPAAGEHILVSSDNSMNAAGQGNFDCYIEGDGTKAATELELKSVDTLIGVFDISAYHATGDVLAKYADLSAALDGGSNIPEAIRKGGMSVKFVQSSDNKYVQYRLMADVFSTNPNEWAFCGNDVYTENPEFVRVVTDTEGRILYGIKTDGEFVFGVGVPQSIKDYVLSQKAEVDADVLAEKTRAMAAEQALSTAKVDKEEGKGLVPTQYIGETKNPEYLYAMTDNEDNVLFGIKVDGEPYFGVGCPEQVKEYIEHKIADLSLDEYEDIVTFLSDYLGGDATLKSIINNLANTKVDKIAGKSLIDAEFAEGVSQVENPEFVEAHTDAEDKVLYGVKKDGDFYFGAGVPSQIQEKLDNKADLAEITEIAANKVDKEEGKSLIDAEYASSQSTIDNPEYIHLITDSEDKVIEGTKTDGTKVFRGDVEVNGQIINKEIQKKIDTAIEDMQQEVDETLSDVKDTLSYFEPREDPEGRTEITTDSEDKIISYRDSDGVKHEEVGIESREITTDSLKLSDGGMTEFQQALKDAGFRPGGAGDYSDTITNKGKNPVYIPMPMCAKLNILSDINLKALSKADKGGTQKVNYDVKVQVEFFDGHGIYFKKWVLISAQGNSSFDLEKKNLSLKFFDTENVENSKGKWGKGNTFGTVFGDWVMQKTYHLKAFHTDFIRGSSVVAYQLAEQVYKTRGEFADRPWKQALIDFSKISSVTPANLSEDGIDDMALQIDNGARCMPDGFPVIVYQQGQFYGIFAWMLKKDAANFNMDEDEARHIHLDGTLTAASLWGGTINWSAFEIRNPEGLICMDGSDYNGDFPSEIIDSTSEHYDSSNPDHIKTAQVKQYIINLSQRVAEINTLDSTDSAAAKVLFDTYFDADNLIDYQLINMACGDNDGFGKNWQWITYDGIKWWCCQYDKDMSFGNYFTGMFTTNPKNGWINSSISMPNGLAIKYYQSEHKSRWLQLVEANIFTAENVKQMVNDWVKRIGQYNFEKEWVKWPEAPCNRDSNIDFANWKFTGGYKQGVPTAPGDVLWDAATQYSAGNRVWFHAFDGNWYLNFIAVQDNIDKPCLTGSYSVYPKSMGYRDSIWRYFKYIEETFNNQNSFINSL